MVFSSFRVWLAVGEFVREGQVPFLYCSFWFMKSGKRVLGSKGEHMPRGQGDPRVAPTTASQAGARMVVKERFFPFTRKFHSLCHSPAVIHAPVAHQSLWK